MVVRDDAPAGSTTRPLLVPMIKWSLMIVALFWTLLYRASQEGDRVPEFMYVNF